MKAGVRLEESLSSCALYVIRAAASLCLRPLTLNDTHKHTYRAQVRRQIYSSINFRGTCLALEHRMELFPVAESGTCCSEALICYWLLVHGTDLVPPFPHFGSTAFSLLWNICHCGGRCRFVLITLMVFAVALTGIDAEQSSKIWPRGRSNVSWV